MKEKKNIERLFQEKFKDFEALPPQDAWLDVEARLQNKKKKRRVIPFWLKPTGIAAGIVIVMGLFNIFNNNNTINDSLQLENNTSNTVVNQNKESQNKFETPSLNEKANSSGGVEKIIQGNEVVTDRNKNSNTINNPNKNNFNSDSKFNNINQKQEVQFASENKKNRIKTKQNNKGYNLEELTPNLDQNYNGNIDDKTTLFSSNNTNKSSNSKDKIGVEKNQNIDLNKSVIDELIPNNDFEGLVEKTNEKTFETNQSNNEILINQYNIDTLKINQVLADNIEVLQDSTQVVETTKEVEENELEKLLKEKEEGKNADEKEKEKRNRWVVSTNVAPVYFNSFSKGSPLDDEFVSNEKSYQTSISYGVGAEYNVSKKIALRSGINSFNLSYNVNDVVFYQDINARQLKNVESNEMGRMISVQSELKNELNEVTTSGNLLSKYEGELNQQLNYIEVPLELSYKLVDSKIGINLIGGMSTLFLQDNSVSLKSNGIEMEIGEATNLNDIHFSGNFGLGFRYTFWKSFNANFQPMLKYQFNTFSESSGNFKPYIVGLYTGLSYSF